MHFRAVARVRDSIATEGEVDSNDVQVIPARDETSSGRIGEFFEQSLSAANLNLVRVLVPWICDVLLSDRSIEAYGTDLVQFAQYLEKNDVSLQNATADHVRLYKASLLRSGARTGTVARKLSVLRGAYRVLADKGIVTWPTANAIASIKSPPVNKNSTPALSAEQARRTAQSDSRRVRFRAFETSLSYRRSLSRGAVCLRSADFELETWSLMGLITMSTSERNEGGNLGRSFSMPPYRFVSTWQRRKSNQRRLGLSFARSRTADRPSSIGRCIGALRFDW